MYSSTNQEDKSGLNQFYVNGDTQRSYGIFNSCVDFIGKPAVYEMV